MNDWFNWVSNLLAVAGLFGTVYYGREARLMTQIRNRFSWTDIEHACHELGKVIKKQIKPDVIVCFAGPSAVVTNLLVEMENISTPITLISLKNRTSKQINIFDNESGINILESTKWRLYVPSKLFELKHAKICIIEDAVISGDSLFLLKKHLIEKGIARENIWTCAIVCSEIAKVSNKAPDKSYYTIENANFFFPWGKGF